MLKIVVAFALVFGSSAMHVHAACHRYVAPYPFPNQPQSWGDDSGPIVGGFIDSKRPDGGVFNALHGIDVAAGNQVDYPAFAECGGSFAIVRINHSITKRDQISGPVDEQFISHLRGFAAHGITGIPYFFFSLPKGMKTLTSLSKSLSDDELHRSREKYVQFGRQAAQLFLRYIAESTSPVNGSPVPESNIAGLRAKFVALDVEEVPVGTSTTLSARNYGRLYAAAVCGWVRTLHETNPDIVPILYTFPAIYGEYLHYALPVDNACLQGLPVWISRTYSNGWEAIRDTDPNRCAQHKSSLCVTDRYVKLTCEIQSGNRCLIHQYTHRGTSFALGETDKRGNPPHLDFNRFYTGKLVRTSTTPQFVRVEDSFR